MLPKTLFDKFIFVMKSVLPRQNKLLGSFYDSKKQTKKLGMRLEKLHVYLKECMLFYKETTYLQECLHCQASRYLSTMEVGRHKKGIIVKVLRYFTIISRL